MTRVFGLAILLLIAVSMWRIFTKAGRPGWQSLVPGYNVFVTFRIADLPMWQAGTLIVLMIARVAVRSTLGASGGGFIFSFALPMASAGLWFVACLGIASKFDKGTAFAIGMSIAPFVFYPILAFGSARYGEPRPSETLGLSRI